jgi:hypothetical protein
MAVHTISPASPAHDRGHEGVQAVRGHAEGPHQQPQAAAGILDMYRTLYLAPN